MAASLWVAPFLLSREHASPSLSTFATYYGHAPGAVTAQFRAPFTSPMSGFLLSSNTTSTAPYASAHTTIGTGLSCQSTAPLYLTSTKSPDAPPSTSSINSYMPTTQSSAVLPSSSASPGECANVIVAPEDNPCSYLGTGESLQCIDEQHWRCGSTDSGVVVSPAPASHSRTAWYANIACSPAALFVSVDRSAIQGGSRRRRSVGMG